MHSGTCKGRWADRPRVAPTEPCHKVITSSAALACNATISGVTSSLPGNSTMNAVPPSTAWLTYWDAVPVHPAVHGVDAVVNPTIDANVLGITRRAPPGETRLASWCQKI